MNQRVHIDEWILISISDDHLRWYSHDIESPKWNQQNLMKEKKNRGSFGGGTFSTEEDEAQSCPLLSSNLFCNLHISSSMFFTFLSASCTKERKSRNSVTTPDNQIGEFPVESPKGLFNVPVLWGFLWRTTAPGTRGGCGHLSAQPPTMPRFAWSSASSHPSLSATDRILHPDRSISQTRTWVWKPADRTELRRFNSGGGVPIPILREMDRGQSISWPCNPNQLLSLSLSPLFSLSYIRCMWWWLRALNSSCFHEDRKIKDKNQFIRLINILTPLQSTQTSII